MNSQEYTGFNFALIGNLLTSALILASFLAVPAWTVFASAQ